MVSRGMPGRFRSTSPVVQNSAAPFDKTQWAEQNRFISHSPVEPDLVARSALAFEGLSDPDVESGRQH